MDSKQIKTEGRGKGGQQQKNDLRNQANPENSHKKSRSEQPWQKMMFFAVLFRRFGGRFVSLPV
jgi:hypothetical protein